MASSVRDRSVSLLSFLKYKWILIRKCSAPILLFTALITLIFAQDHPAGKWSERHTLPAAAIAHRDGDQLDLRRPEKESRSLSDSSKNEKDTEAVTVHPVIAEEDLDLIKSTVDVAINEPLTLKTTLKILKNPLTWLPSLAYLTTFGIELAIDSKFADILYTLFRKKLPGFDQTTAGYYTSILYAFKPWIYDWDVLTRNRGFLNLVTRPAGGYIGDVVYRRYGTQGKKAWTLICGLIMGAALVGGGVYMENTRAAGSESRTSHIHVTCLPISVLIVSTVSILMGAFSVAMIFSEFGNGANFALVPHCNAYNNVSSIFGSSFLFLHTSKHKSLTRHLYHFLGSHVWARRFLRKPGWHYLCAHIPIRTSCWESILDHGRHLSGYQHRADSCFCSCFINLPPDGLIFPQIEFSVFMYPQSLGIDNYGMASFFS